MNIIIQHKYTAILIIHGYLPKTIPNLNLLTIISSTLFYSVTLCYLELGLLDI